MVVAGLVGAAWTAVGGAYAYNMNRFQFDAGQQQSSRHQSMNLRITQWQIFREDVRDLFQLTTANMSTYMVVGTLFFSVGMSYLSASVKDFPTDPSWTLVFWGNSLLTSLAYGLLAVWLSMHGAIAAHSAGVKVLTQAIRVPIPTTAELEDARGRLHNYESDPRRFLQLPDFLGADSAGEDEELRRKRSQMEVSLMSSSPRYTKSVASMASGSAQVQHPASSGVGHMVEGDSTFASHTSEPMIGAAQTAQTQELAAEMLRDKDWGGPGRGAAFDSHIRLFRQMYLTYACYDAYARIALSAAVHELLLGCAYLVVAHSMCKRGHENPMFMWSALVFVSVTTIVLFKLDLYVEKARIRRTYVGLCGGPLTVGIAAQLSSLRAREQLTWLPADVVDIIVVLSSLLHLSWSVLLMLEAKPMVGEFRVPLSWRSVRYLDIFGWMEGHEAGDSQVVPRSEPPAESVDVVKRQCRRLVKKSEMLKKSAGGSLDDRDADTLGKIMSDLGFISGSLGISAGSGAASIQTTESIEGRQAWLECDCFDSMGVHNFYYMNIFTGDVTWTRPDQEHLLNLSKLADDVSLLENRLVEETQGALITAASSMENSPAEHWGKEPIFPSLARRPGSTHHGNSMPWRYFRQVCLLNIALWSVTTAWVFYTAAFDSFRHRQKHTNLAGLARLSHPGRSKAVSVGVRWPHQFFRPSTIACDGVELLVRDRFNLYVSDLPSLNIQENELLHTTPSLKLRHLRIPDFVEPWKALAFAPSMNSSSTSLLLLGKSGRDIEEIALETPRGGSRTLRRWTVSHRLESPLQTFIVLSRTSVAACNDPNKVGDAGADDNDVGADDAPTTRSEEGWAVYGVTHEGELVLLCPDPKRGSLEPMYALFSVAQPFSTAIEEWSDVIGLHLDGASTFWFLTRRALADDEELADVSAWTLDGVFRGRWVLPRGRRWSSGLCAPAARGGVLVTADLQEGPGARPELWHLNVDVAPVCAAADGCGTDTGDFGVTTVFGVNGVGSADGAVADEVHEEEAVALTPLV
eukprot:TRINITY_DN3470_c0_g1_i2.p1 TRINITY_DN3470_c0_g1~~TRINITY_DN3470_c0_g1_i2.p1  ORF type:complete len:1063 (+),score=135.04 TRINITY_DN3470_c0_g1_i2:105-3191(+)